MATAARYRPTDEPDLARLRHARWGVLGLFFTMGVVFSTLLSRYPSFQTSLGVDNLGFALLLIFGSGGALCALLLVGWAAARFGTRPLLTWSAVIHTLTVIGVGAAGQAGSREAFAASLFLVAFTFAFTNVSMNAEAAYVEQKIGRKIMPQFHAAWSIGAVVGAAVGALYSHYGVKPLWHVLTVAVATGVVRVAIIPAATVDGRPVGLPGAAPIPANLPRLARVGRAIGGPFVTARNEYRDRRVLAIGAIVFAASMTEGAAAQWIEISGHKDYGQPESVGALMYWLFLVAMVTVRSLGTQILERIGRVRALRISAVCVIAGLLVFAFAPTVWLVPLALVLWGVGAALGIPISVSAAADDPKHAASRVAAVSSFSTIAGVSVPPLIGLLGDAVSTRRALLLVIVGSVTSFALARAVRRDAKLFTSARLRLRFRRPDPLETGVAIAPSDTGTTLG